MPAPTHRRQEIRDKAEELLTAALAEAEIPVTVCRDYTAQPDDQPSVAVSTPTETVLETLQVDPPKRRFAVELVIEAIVAGKGTSREVKNEVDNLCSIIENALDGTLGGVAERCELQSTATDTFAKAKQTLGLAVLVYQVAYVHTITPILPESVTDLTSIHNDFDLADPSLPSGGPDGQIDAQLTVEFGDPPDPPPPDPPPDPTP